MEIVYSNNFKKQLKRINYSDAQKILSDVLELEISPYLGKKLRGRLSDLRKFRIGNYRVLYKISNEIILLTDVGHRQNIYD
ncbi:MAG: type II toxin-antitoxin system RelE/ParE family toxin [Candidatus Micrarchaeota archaeon]